MPQALQVKNRKTADLIPYARNARKHSEQQVSQIAASIKEFGFNVPVLVDKDNGIIAGHGRVLAAQKLGIESVPTIAIAHLTENQKKAYILIDNKLALNSEWDADMLKIELEGLAEIDFNVEEFGFTENYSLSSTELEKESSAKEIDVDAMQFGCRCPKCGFEFNEK